MEREWQAILSRYGQPVTVYLPRQEEGAQTRAIVQPVLTGGEDQRVPSPLGMRREDRFLYLGPAKAALSGGDGSWLSCGKMRYEVETAQAVYVWERVSYWWAVLRPGEEEP